MITCNNPDANPRQSNGRPLEIFSFHLMLQDEDDAGMDEDEEDSSEDSDDLEGMSLPSDSILSRPGVPSTIIAPPLAAQMPAAVLAAQFRPPKPPHRSATAGHGMPGGSKRSHQLFSPPQRYSGDDMAVSYHSPSSLGGVMGTSPVLVTYQSPGGSGGNQFVGGSPMQMTPVFSSLEQSMHSRLGQR